MAPPSVRSVETITKSADGARLGQVSTLAELVSTLPALFRPTLGKKIQDAHRVALKAASVQSTLASYQRHQTEGTFPPLIKGMVKEPKVQFSKEFRGTNEGAAAEMAMIARADASRTALLGEAIAQKKLELTFLQKSLTFNASEWLTAVLQTTENYASQCGGSIVKKSDGGYTLDGMPSGLAHEFDTVRLSGKHFHLRAISLAQAASSREIVAKMAKLKVKENTDAEMTGIDNEKSTKAIIKEETEKIREQLRKELLKNLPKKGKKKSQPKKPKGVAKKSGNRKGGKARKGKK